MCVRVLERYYQTHTHAHVPNDLTCFAVKNRGERCLQDAVDADFPDGAGNTPGNVSRVNLFLNLVSSSRAGQEAVSGSHT